jgi:hypothetical protein
VDESQIRNTFPRPCWTQMCKAVPRPDVRYWWLPFLRRRVAELLGRRSHPDLQPQQSRMDRGLRPKRMEQLQCPRNDLQYDRWDRHRKCNSDGTTCKRFFKRNIECALPATIQHLENHNLVSIPSNRKFL